MLGADAELDQLIYDGRRSAPPPGGQRRGGDYLGIPGLLDADADARPVAAQAGRAARQADRRGRHAAGRPPPTASFATCAGSSTRWSRCAHHRTGKPHGWIHNELRRLCGGPVVAAANSEQIAARIDAVRTLRA